MTIRCMSLVVMIMTFVQAGFVSSYWEQSHEYCIFSKFDSVEIWLNLSLEQGLLCRCRLYTPCCQSFCRAIRAILAISVGMSTIFVAGYAAFCPPSTFMDVCLFPVRPNSLRVLWNRVCRPVLVEARRFHSARKGQSCMDAICHPDRCACMPIPELCMSFAGPRVAPAARCW